MATSSASFLCGSVTGIALSSRSGAHGCEQRASVLVANSSCNNFNSLKSGSGYRRDGVWEGKGRSRVSPPSAVGPSGLEPDPSSSPIVVTTDVELAIPGIVEEAGTSVEDLKLTLVDTLYGTDRGLNASSETRGEIVEIIARLEAKNPTAAPTDALALLDGKWILAYTSFSELFPLLAAGSLPLVKVGQISQTFDSTTFTIQNTVCFTGPLATTSFSNTGIFEIRSPKRVQVRFEEGAIGTPQLTDSIEIPDTVTVLGQKIDLAAFQAIVRPLQDAASSVAKTISGQPPLKFSIRDERAQSWLLTTYLDDDLRISRGDGGSLYVLIKEGSPLLESA